MSNQGHNCIDQYRFLDEKGQLTPFITQGKELYESVLDFGLYVINHCNNNHKNLLSDAPIMMLLREILEVYDSISILAENMATRPAQVPLRAQMELYLQLKFIFSGDTHEKAMAYHVNDVLNKIESYKHLATIGELTQASADRLINNLETMLSTVEYAPIRDRIRNMRAQPGKQYAPWYTAYDASARNLKGLATGINRDDTYNLYGPLSKYAHGFKSMEGVQVDFDGSPGIRLFRVPTDYVNLLEVAGSFSADSIRLVYAYYCTAWELGFIPWYQYWCSQVEGLHRAFPKVK